MNPSTTALQATKVRKSLQLDATTALLWGSAAAIGALGWSGNSALNYAALLYPFAYLRSRNRVDALSAVFYYGASTHSVIAGAQSFFGMDHLAFLPLSLWLGLVVLSSSPWVMLYTPRFRPLSAISAMLLLAIPPLGLLTVAHPLLGAGRWLPGLHWAGLLLPLALIALHEKLGTVMTLALLIAAAFVAHECFVQPSLNGMVVCVNTHWGSAEADPAVIKAHEQESQRIALEHPNALVLFPESALPIWTPTNDLRWESTASQLRNQRTSVLMGTTIPIANSKASVNVLLAQGADQQFSYVQRVPVPLGMWNLFDSQKGFPLMLHYPSTIRVGSKRAGVLICYEQLLVWPALQSLSRQPDMLLAPSNLYWSSKTNIPAIEHVSAQNWANLWGLPLYEARNL